MKTSLTQLICLLLFSALPLSAQEDTQAEETPRYRFGLELKGHWRDSACQQMETSDLLLEMNPDVVLPLGDIQYESGELDDFLNFFDPSWGRLKAKMRPAVGNHEYKTTDARGYFDYFNGTGNFTGPGGDRDKGYYAFTLGAWRIYAINSNCGKAGGCRPRRPACSVWR